MKLFGSSLKTVFALLMVIASLGARAELTASVDRERVAMGDTIRLTVTATADEPINNIDPRPLQRDFDILQRSSSSSVNIINGSQTSTRQVVFEISPKREGTLRVPPLRVGRQETNYLLVAVGPATTAAGDPLVHFEAELDTNSVYVQAQAILTLRILQAINLESRSVTELELDHAFVKQLEQKSFQRTIAGRPWLVHEIRYAIFPEQSGSLEIPVQTFTARERGQRRSVFDIGGTGRALKRTTEALTLNVLPRPNAFPAATWLPAGKIEISETWSTPPEHLRVGESATRRITITGQGLQGAQLPPVLFPTTPGLKYYPDQPVINDTELSSGVQGARVDSAALVPTREGNWDIPEIRIPWWDTNAGTVRYAVVPGRKLMVAASMDIDTPLSLPAPTASPDFDTTPITVAAASQSSRLWMAVALVSTMGWILTGVFFVVRSRSKQADPNVAPQNLSESNAFKKLLAACATQNTLQARQQLIQWTCALLPERNIHSLDQVDAAFNDPELSAALQTINHRLYGSPSQSWEGTDLAEVVKRLRKNRAADNRNSHPVLELYPQHA